MTTIFLNKLKHDKVRIGNKMKLLVLAGCAIAGMSAIQDTSAASGYVLGCTNVDPTIVNSLSIVCDSLGHCNMLSQPPNAASGLSYPLKVISSGHGYVTWQNVAAQVRVVMKLVANRPDSADIYSNTGLAASCK